MTYQKLLDKIKEFDERELNSEIICWNGLEELFYPTVTLAYGRRQKDGSDGVRPYLVIEK